ncbi:MAG TPA: hypothetical protein VJN39_02160 [Gemmatimonadales bacterium]|nr:hypothetical protein [Gemmatimonadales bacterium]
MEAGPCPSGTTYEIFAAYWPHHGDGPIGKAFNKATKYVVTRTRWAGVARLGQR